MSIGQQVRRDLAGIGVHGHMQLHPSPACPAVLGSIPLALTEQFQAGAVQHKMDWPVAGMAAWLATSERSSSPAERRMVRHAQLKPEQLQHAPGKRLRLAQREMEHEAEREHEVDSQVGIQGLATWSAPL